MRGKKMEMPFPLTKQKNNFVLKLSKELYKNDTLKKALAEDKSWVQEKEASDKYYCLQLNTSEIEDVLNWMNYLIYLQKG